MKKILYIISDDSFGGGSQCVLDLVENIDGKKFTPMLISKNYKIHERLKNKSLCTALQRDRCQNYAIAMRSARDQKSVKEIQAIIKKEKPDIIHLHATRAGILGTLGAKDLNIPIVYTEHLYTKEYQPKNKFIFWLQLKTFRKLSPNITKVIAVSNAVKDFLVNKNVFPKKKIEVIYNGVKSYNTKHITYNKYKIIIGSVGVLEPIKGYKYLLKAIGKIKIPNPEIYNKINLEIIGKGSEKEDLKRLTDKLDISTKIRFLGSVNEIEKQMQKWDLYIQPSLSESFGLALAKAMSMGIPVIATNAGAMSELIENGKSGIIIPAKNPGKLEQSVIELLKNKDLRLKFGKNARTRIINNFSLEKMVKKTEELYEKIA